MHKGRTHYRPSARKNLCVKPGSRTSGQIQRIHGAAAELGIIENRDFIYMQIFRITGVEKMGQLSQSQADQVIKDFERQIANRRRRQSRPNVVGLQTREQREKIDWIKVELSRIGIENPAAYIESVAQRQFKKPANRLTVKQTQSLIEALKSIIDRKA